ncbi:MAG: hypothetical protein IJ055_07325 [Oscillospiraceae bacterium]|nr:hypothetical protein [Oscillospiraceae bacterium]
MEFDLRKGTDVVFRGRKAILAAYFDAACLLFDRREKPKWEDLKLIDKYYPKKRFLFFSNIPCRERMEITRPDGRRLFGCYCESLPLGQDLPRDLCREGLIEILGEDPFDYEMTGEGYRKNDPNVYAHVRCNACKTRYRVHFHDGYRVSYPKWELDEDTP